MRHLRQMAGRCGLALMVLAVLFLSSCGANGSGAELPEGVWGESAWNEARWAE